MTNFELITGAAIAEGIYTEQEIVELIKQTGDLPLHTFAEWKRMGYRVKKGEHAKMTCFIWKWSDKQKTVEQEDGNEVEIDASHFYKTKAFFFTKEQVEKTA